MLEGALVSLKKKTSKQKTAPGFSACWVSASPSPPLYLFICLAQSDDGLHWKHALPMSVLIKWLTSMKCTNTQGPPFKFLKAFSYHALS